MSAASAVVTFAASTLPRRIRDRYREQWLADLRDAEAAGVRPSEIVIASIAFAATVARPIPARPRAPYDAVVDRRSRLASALALSCAVVGVSQFAGFNSHSGLTRNGIYDFVILFLSPALMGIYLAIAPLVALIVVAATRRMSTAVRWAVCLLILASFAGVAHGIIESGRDASTVENIYFTPGTASYAVAVLLGLLAGALLLHHFRDRTVPRSPRHRPLLAGALGVNIAAVSLGLINLLHLRSELHHNNLSVFENLPDAMRQHVHLFAGLLARSEQATIAALIAWGTIAGVVSVFVGVWGFIQPRYAVARSLALLCVLLISHAGVVTFVWLFSFGGPGVHLTVPEEVLLLIGRWGLVAIILYTVGGVRYAGAHDRQDLELIES